MKEGENKNKEESGVEFSSVREHLDTGYQNTQKLIQFQDIKASTLIGINTLMAGFVVLVCKWVISLEVADKDLLIRRIAPESIGYWATCVGFLFALISLVYTAISIGYCISAITPRSPKTSRFMPYILFPFHNSESETCGDELVAHIDLLLSGEEPYKDFIFNEYKRQLIQVGDIVFKKVISLKSAVYHQKRQIFFAGLAVITLCCTSVILVLIGVG